MLNSYIIFYCLNGHTLFSLHPTGRYLVVVGSPEFSLVWMWNNKHSCQHILCSCAPLLETQDL